MAPGVFKVNLRAAGTAGDAPSGSSSIARTSVLPREAKKMCTPMGVLFSGRAGDELLEAESVTDTRCAREGTTLAVDIVVREHACRGPSTGAGRNLALKEEYVVLERSLLEEWALLIAERVTKETAV